MNEAIARTEAPSAPRFQVGFATTPDGIAETQRLRYRIFAGELGASIDGGIDRDRFDPWCRHLTVRENATGRLVACTRMLAAEDAVRAGGFYSAGEFDLAMVDALPGRCLEIGRTCVDLEYRSGAVIGLLWQGIARHVLREGYDYLFGCASIPLADGGVAAHAILSELRTRCLSPGYQRVRPYEPLPLPDAAPTGPHRMPPLLKAYVSLGAKACGDAYWDREFNCADVFMMLNIPELHPRYARHFLGRAPARTEADAVSA